MHPRHFVFITLLALCHLQLAGQVLTNALPPANTPDQKASDALSHQEQAPLPEDPDQYILPVAHPEPSATAGVPVRWEARQQMRVGDTWTLQGEVVVFYRDYILRADKVVYHQSTSELDADGHLQLEGGPQDALITASHGSMILDSHTARLFDVDGSLGIRRSGNTVVYSTPNPFLFHGRVLMQDGDGNYRIIDGSMTNCRLPHPDWEIFAQSIRVAQDKASTTNSVFKLVGIPIFYLPYLSHPVNENGRSSGLLIPVVSSGSSIRGFTFGEQFYWAINRSTDMVVGAEYFSKRGYAPNGDFRYKGAGLNHLTARWNALLDRGIEQEVTTGPNAGTYQLVNQGGVDLVGEGRKDLTDETRVAGNVEYLSSYVYRLVFADVYSQAVNSQVLSDVSITHAHRGFVPSASLDRFQTFASTATGDEVRILHLPNLRYDVLDQPIGYGPGYWEAGTSLGYMTRSEPEFHVRNLGRIDLYPRVSFPLHAGGWSMVPAGALRETFYSARQIPDLTGASGGIPTISHDPLNRFDAEASLDARAPAVARDFSLGRWNRTMRHVIEPELTYRFVGGIAAQARNVPLIDTSDIATNTNELGYTVTQRLFLRPIHPVACPEDAAKECATSPREWASWRISQKYFLDPNFGGALIPNRRNVFDSTLDLSGVAFLTTARNFSPLVSRMRFEAIDRLRIGWDLDYDPNAGRIEADNVYSGYSWSNTTVGLGYAMLNAVDEQRGVASTIRSQQIQPFLYIGSQSHAGFNLAANGGYDFVQRSLQFAGVQTVYNWDCCGLTVGYRRFQLGTLGSVSRDETEWLYSFTLANFGSMGDIRRANSVFRDPTQPPAY
ncbi:MAG: LPS assembly protein LptD [Terracidiphilus sp.]